MVNCTTCGKKVWFLNRCMINNLFYCKECCGKEIVRLADKNNLAIINSEGKAKLIKKGVGYCKNCKLEYPIYPNNPNLSITGPESKVFLEGISGVVLVTDQDLICPKCKGIGILPKDKNESNFISITEMKKELNLD